ncbi:hypothetical protein HKBW3S03_00519 [Candidatus Hakubella thermalkaliphila]|uniref:NADPH-dependent FMN reductase-like domain-containing protein n=1 Tax=Candidatus Hakubella thermalkaliphila TaxID=2754717 RepID=A0A6V8QA29_9ACTN|nr:flavodoxin family protein [Candidatus Hakubella thermalkaliphila]GFP19015.1 hypothetical protein HKBW3S03_00519 [Candidatus Hakubella thermalkaliphila]GFP23145.1 hypothetical protein HKBW3S09_00612 [Candidatus Hakubella thermalkaliphila]GFP36506.1 hypothetical protein HKBW3S44_00189 [Candidatus Hakubella thermalkaliphila]GFP38584.1 hypothetical protein HKBW3S47_00285 [Candidatus Hakubella thermalkaliphila]GFP41443.1 hypothetical protein HKBW3C_00568 [Candidatus Hakubella thermalkaliphila]
MAPGQNLWAGEKGVKNKSGREKIKVLGIAASPRRGGNTDILLDRVLEGAASRGAEVEKVVLRGFNIEPCRECNSCQKTGQCVVEDDMQLLYSKIEEANALILASPIFFMSVSAYAKAFIERCQAMWARKYVLGRPLGKESTRSRRRGMFICVGATKGSRLFEGAILTMKYFFDAIDMQYHSNLLYRNVEDKGEIKDHPEALEEAFKAGQELVDFEKEPLHVSEMMSVRPTIEDTLKA